MWNQKCLTWIGHQICFGEDLIEWPIAHGNVLTQYRYTRQMTGLTQRTANAFLSTEPALLRTLCSTRNFLFPNCHGFLAGSTQKRAVIFYNWGIEDVWSWFYSSAALWDDVLIQLRRRNRSTIISYDDRDSEISVMKESTWHIYI